MKAKNKLTIIDQLGICFFNNTYTKKGHKQGTEDIPFYEYIDSVRNPDDEYIAKVQLIRRVKKCKSLKDAQKLKISDRILSRCKKIKDLYGKLKWKAYHVYPSCQFDKEGCRIKNVTSVSGLLVYDLQGVEDEIHEKLCAWKHTVALHQSIGGAPGDYALFLYCPGLAVDSFNSMWEKGNDLIIKEFGVKPDSSDECKDVTRIRYLSYDPEIFYNPYAEPVLVSDIVIATQFTDEQKAKINKYLNSEPKWFKFLMALAVAKGEDGRQLAHTFSRENSKKYNAEDLDKKYDRCLDEVKNNKRDEGVTAATLFWQLKEMDVPYLAPRVEGSREDDEEVTTEQVIQYLNSQWCRNEINDKVLNIHTGEEVNVETVWTTFQLAFNDPKGFPINTIHAFIRSKQMNTINPVKNFFNQAREVYDGDKYIDQFIASLPLVDPVAGGLFVRWWCINAYRQAMHNVTNRTFLIMKGGEEIGKSRALGWLCPLEGYLKTGPLNTDSKDTRIALAHNFLWNDDELKVFRAYDINKVKALISTDVINERSPYARSSETYKRICSFTGSTNEDELLPSTEGNTRFLVLELKPGALIKWNDYMQIDKHQFWGEVMRLDERAWIEKHKEELSENRERVNKANVINNVIRDAILQTFTSSINEPLSKRVVYTLKDIVEEIDPEGRLHAHTQQNLVRDVICREFGPSRTNGHHVHTGKPTRGYPVMLKRKTKGNKL